MHFDFLNAPSSICYNRDPLTIVRTIYHMCIFFQVTDPFNVFVSLAITTSSSSSLVCMRVVSKLSVDLPIGGIQGPVLHQQTHLATEYRIDYRVV